MTSRQEEGTVARMPDAAELDTRAPAPASLTESGGDADVPPEAPRRRRRGMRLGLVIACAIVVAAVGGAAATGVIGGGSGKAEATESSGPTATAKVRRTTLSTSQTVDGQLGYGDATTLQAPSRSGSSGEGTAGQGGASAGNGAGIVTWMPADGDTVTRGEPVYKVDQKSVPLLYGSIPLYRTLRDGSTGSDVAMLEKNLWALGYRGFTVDDTYSSDTAAAVRKWQKKLGRAQTGEVQVGDAVVAGGARRVGRTDLSFGDALAGNVLSWTGTERVISVDLDVQYANLVKKGGRATVTLPDNTTVSAVVTNVGTPTSSSSSASGSSGSAGSSGAGSSGSSRASNVANATVPVELRVDDTKKLGGYQAAAVSVAFASETHPNVLAVPVSALVALPKGGYAVEVVNGATTEYRPVKLGMFGNGMVEVSGPGVVAGTVVGVPE